MESTLLDKDLCSVEKNWCFSMLTEYGIPQRVIGLHAEDMLETIDKGPFLHVSHQPPYARMGEA